MNDYYNRYGIFQKWNTWIEIKWALRERRVLAYMMRWDEIVLAYQLRGLVEEIKKQQGGLP